MPALWQRVLDTLGETGTLDSVRFADSGTSTTPPELLGAIAKACPDAFLRVFYGSTEAGNVASLTGDDVFTKPVQLRRAEPGDRDPDRRRDRRARACGATALRRLLRRSGCHREQRCRTAGIAPVT